MAGQDPRTKFSNKDFPKQEQPVPGLQSKLDPKPDCGETSYTGYGRLNDYKMLVTGGDSAIGRAAAIAYAKEGADVAINYLPAEQQDAEEVQQVIEAAGRKAVLIPGDIRDEQFNYDLVETAYNELGGLDNVTIVAGHQQYRESIKGFDTASFSETFETNVYPIFWTVQKAVDYLQAGATITLTSSVQGYNPSPILHDYAASKAAIISLTKSLSEELGAKGIRVNCVAPGPFWSPLQISGGQPQSKIPSFGQKEVLGRAGQPVELSGTYVHLAAEESSYTTGQVYGVTGGTQLD
ncbi:NAD(P)-dependent oxidoreductase [Staphylococcus saprophyticus]|jgi:NAD(P)-dependent dehydrogenase (short-subunit alcohol dehydrogenase family)|uniref:Putative short chain dehydrogenase n=2 Tax=Staphylococcus TaxID=1279 RepID=Q49ZQ3_STAS1|nr:MULTISPECIES: SDR family oxidoreductase [Staphylococcus]AMG19652.1 KR domain-containing protein [Staphylococcus saprophyticus]AMG32756.1 KR domain-containing protein [Staphylococcus saprophyticus]ASE58692.1 KR domain-containing protein [Staphylococcus saprophyticus]ASF19663.1 KR domain-containing protein [Staphylococcus saprophyticus]EHY93292.1 putative short chain dehydrogenase [Staphylococcus saprophyticus subsp. saprophyticus KACC 16562]